MSLKALAKSCDSAIIENKSRSKKSSNVLNQLDISFWENEPIFCPYQIKLATDESPVLICEKGRQIGFSWTMSFRSTVKAIKNEKDTLINSYNKDAVKQFIKDCASWAKILNQVFELICNEKIVNDQLINIFEIRFNNGRSIVGLPGTPTSFRSYSGRDIIVDEAAYREFPLSDYIAACMATLIHGGTVRIGSTHNGLDGDFNLLIEDVKAGKLPYKIVNIPFKKAVAEGLYKRICAKKKEIWTPDKEQEWIQSVYSMYGVRASEELDAIPSDYSQEGKIFNEFGFYDLSQHREHELIRFRYHDLAGTDDKEEEIESIYYSASVQITFIIESNLMVISDWTADKCSPLEGDKRIEELAIEDGSKAYQIIEQEPGASGIKYVQIMIDRLIGYGLYNVHPYAPKMPKMKRIIPAANAAASKKLLVDINLKERDKFCSTLRKLSSKKVPLVTDLGDCISGAYLFISDEFNYLLSGTG